jgi:PAS domain S-box-containing protein
MYEIPRNRPVAYGVALLGIAISLFIRYPLWPVLGQHTPFLTFIPAVVLSAYLGGFGPGLLATLLGALAGCCFITELPWSFRAPEPYEGAAFVLFVLTGAIISGLNESLHRAQLRIAESERQRGEEALRETEERFRQLADNIHEIFWMMDDRERMIYISPAYEEASGRTRQALYEQPRSWADVIHPDDRDKMLQTVAQYRHGTFPEVEFRVVRPDGSVRWLRSRAFPLNDQLGHLSHFAGLAEDITERKHAEEALAQERYLLHALMDNLPDNMYFKDDACRFTRVNKALTNYFGLAGPEQAIGKTDFDFFTGEHAWAAYADEQEILRTGVPVVGKEEKETWLDGRVRWVSTTRMPFRDRDGKIIGTFGVARDITRLKLAEEELRASEQRFRAFVDHATDAFFLQDDQGIILDVNRQVCASLGYTRDELVGMVPPDFDPDATPALLDELGLRLNAGDTVTFESRHRRKDGSLFPVEVRGRAFWEGGRRFLVSLARDVSERKQDEALLDGQKHILERIIQGEPLANVLAFLCRTIEELAHGEMLASVLLLDPDGAHLRHGAAPSLPESYNRAVDGVAIGPSVGSCGTAAYRHEPVYVSDIATDPLWAPYAELALSHGLRACWSSPILSSAGEVLGTFAMYYRQPRQPTARDLRVVDIVARTVAIAIERSRAEQALRASEQRWRGLTEALPQLVWSARPDGSCDYFSTQWTQHTGVPERDLLGWRWLETLHPDDRERTRHAWTASVQGPGAYDVEYRVRRWDGEYRWFKTRGVPIRDSAGNIVNWFGTCTDVTAGKQLEEELRRANARLDQTVRGSNVGLWEVEMPDGIYRNGRVHHLNFWEQLGYECPEGPVDYATWTGYMHPEDRERVERAARACLDGKTKEYRSEYRVLHRDGAYRWVLSRGIAVRDTNGLPIRFLGSRTDITELKRAMKELHQAKEAAESANRAKDEFLANVSHELRTPMNAILGMTELALDTPLTEDQRQCLKTVKSAADGLLVILNDLLDFAKIEAGKMELAPEGFSLRSAVGDTLRALAMRAHKKGLELVCEVRPDVPDALVGDAGRLRQVLVNLVGNAIKFTEHGEVVVRVACAACGLAGDAEEGAAKPQAAEVELRFEVSDTGIGIPPDKQDRIFRAFEQEDTSTTRKYGGTGLGLTIASRLLALMGGEVRVDSEPGRGSTFAFTARFTQQARPSRTDFQSVPPPALLHDLRVLIVDDNATNRHVLKEWLRGWQMEPRAVSDGQAALAALQHAVRLGQPYPLVLLDARMPEMDGLALAASIRERAELSATRLILLTSEDRPGDWARIHELGIDAHLLKPVQREGLLETICRVMSATGSDAPARPLLEPASGVAQTPAPSAAPLRILVAEDNELNAQLLELLLVRRGHRVRLANTGREALALAEQCGPDLMLLDIHMPELDGFGVVGAIRQRERATGRHLPIIALTARSRAEDRQRCLEAGMDDFLAKPVQVADLWAAIDRVMAERPGESSAGPAEAMPGRQEAGLVGPAVLLAACGGDDAILRKICQALQARLPEHVTAVEGALCDGDAPRLREAAHKLCGMVAAFSPVTAAVASDLEDQAADGRLEKCRPLVEELEGMARELIHQVDGLSVETLRHQAGAAVG